MASTRDKIIAKLAEALAPTPDEMQQATAVASEIEAAMHGAHGEGKEYTTKARSLVFNLTKNKELRKSVLAGIFPAENFVRASVKELAPAHIKLQRMASSERYFSTRQLGDSSEVVVGWKAGTSGRLEWSHKYETNAAAAAPKPGGAVETDGSTSQAGAADEAAVPMEDEEEEVAADVAAEEGAEDEDAAAGVAGDVAMAEDSQLWRPDADAEESGEAAAFDAADDSADGGTDVGDDASDLFGDSGLDDEDGAASGQPAGVDAPPVDAEEFAGSAEPVEADAEPPQKAASPSPPAPAPKPARSRQERSELLAAAAASAKSSGLVLSGDAATDATRVSAAMDRLQAIVATLPAGAAPAAAQ